MKGKRSAPGIVCQYVPPGRLNPPFAVGLRRRLPTRPGRAGSGTMFMAKRALASLGFRV